MLPEIVWAMPRFGTFNVHAALLPQYRGAAPINWAIINGETETGVTTFFLDHDIDTGKIILQERFPIPDDADVEYVYDGLMHLGAEIALETVDLIISSGGKVSVIPQEEILSAIYSEYSPLPLERGRGRGCQLSIVNCQLKTAPKLFKENCRIDWYQSVKNIYNFVRGLSPVPSAWTTLVPLAETELHTPIDLKIFKTQMASEACEAEPGTLRTVKNRLFVATADAWLEILDLQQAGKKRMTARDFLNGFKNPTEFRLK